jgi:hypothetical protein
MGEIIIIKKIDNKFEQEIFYDYIHLDKQNRKIYCCIELCLCNTTLGSGGRLQYNHVVCGKIIIYS